MTAGGQRGGKWKHVQVLPVITTPTNTPDFAPYIEQEVSRGAQCIVFESGNPADIVAVQKAAASNPKHPLVSVPGVDVSPAQLQSAGTASNGLQVNAQVPNQLQDIGSVPAYRAAVKKYEGSGAVTDFTGVKVWGAFQSLQQAAKGLSSITRASLYTALSHATVNPGFGAPPIDFAKPGYIPALPRIKASTYFGQVAENGTFVPDTMVGPNGQYDIAGAYP
jgi:hypothetical protein